VIDRYTQGRGEPGSVLSDEIKVNHKKLLDITKSLEEVYEPIFSASEVVEEAEPNVFNWGLQFNAMFAAHAETKAVFAQNLKSWADKTIKEDFGERLGITAAIWKEAEESSKPKGGEGAE